MKPLPLVIPKGLRFSCHACGVCCRGYTVALEEGEAERIARHRWAREGERFREGFLAEGEDGRLELRKVDGACIFLGEDGLCLVHARLGYEAKPQVCRKYPFVFVAAPDGVRATVTIECASRWRSLATGTPAEEGRRELERYAARVVPLRTRWRVQATEGGRLLEPAEYLALEARLRGALAGEGPIEDALRAMARAVGGRASGESIDAAIARLRPGVLEAARAHGDETAALPDRPADWRAALTAADARPDARAFLRAMLAGWIDEAVPGRNPTAEDGVGQMALGVLLTAALAEAPEPAALNLAARGVALLFRGRAAPLLRARTGGFAALSRALAVCPAPA